MAAIFNHQQPFATHNIQQDLWGMGRGFDPSSLIGIWSLNVLLGFEPSSLIKIWSLKFYWDQIPVTLEGSNLNKTWGIKSQEDVEGSNPKKTWGVQSQQLLSSPPSRISKHSRFDPNSIIIKTFGGWAGDQIPIRLEASNAGRTWGIKCQ